MTGASEVKIVQYMWVQVSECECELNEERVT